MWGCRPRMEITGILICMAASGLGGESYQILSKRKKRRPPHRRSPLFVEVYELVITAITASVSPIWETCFTAATSLFPFVVKGIIQMDSDKSPTLPDNTPTLDDRSLSNIARFDKTRHKLIACATNRPNIRRIALIRFYFLP